MRHLSFKIDSPWQPLLAIVGAGMKSMTGYGWGERAEDGFKVTVELSSVNRKQSEISVYLPRELEALEPRLRDEINRRIARGRLTVKVSMQAADGSWNMSGIGPVYSTACCLAILQLDNGTLPIYQR